MLNDFHLPGGEDALGRFVAKLFECREEATELFSVGVSHRSKVILEAFDGIFHRSKRFWRLGKCSPDVGKDFRSLENEF